MIYLKKQLHRFFFLIALVGMIGCSDYLDVVPDNTPSLDDAFSNRAVTERFLFSCYSYLPDITNPYDYPSFLGCRDEIFAIDGRLNDLQGGRLARGEQNTNSPLMNYWAGTRSMFAAIRHCNIFLENAHVPRDIIEEERQQWIAEVKFLKAYYHFFLLRLYGPIPLIKENIPLSADPEEVKVFREPFDEGVDYIVQLLDEAIPYLPMNVANPVEEDGRITKPIAMGIKAKVLTLAASPLFNGNPYYGDWVDSRGVKLMPANYDAAKWERAATAIKNAIDTCHLAGYELYRFNKNTAPQTFNMNDSLVNTMTPRKAVTERWNKGVIWSSMDRFASGKGGTSAFYNLLGDFQRGVFPVMYPQDKDRTVGFLWASLTMGELFYSNNGVPIDEDKSWDYSNRYKLRTATVDDNHQFYIATGYTTVNMNFNREPRFYGNLGFDGSYVEIGTSTENNGATFSPHLQHRRGGPNVSGAPAYVVKKLVAFETTCSQGKQLDYRGYDYRFPLLRLADLYLLYSEALNEIKNSPDDEVYYWIDQVRSMTDLKGVVESWENHSRFPNAPKNKEGMREIIRQERLIELAFEGRRFFDIRRWQLAEDLWTKPRYTWNTDGTTPETYYKLTFIEERQREFPPQEYLWPISIYDLRINDNLVQSYGW